MIDKEYSEMIAKAAAVQKCTENIDIHSEWICHITEKMEKLNVMESCWVEVLGYVGESGNTTNVDIPLGSDDMEEIIELIKEKLKKEIQEYKNSISEEYEKLNELLK